MSYATIEAALSSVIQKITDFDGNNVSQGNWLILGHGKAKSVVLMPGPFTQEDSSMNGHTLITWIVDVELYILWSGEQATVVATLKTQRQLIVDEVNKFRKLDATSGVLNAIIQDGDAVEPFQSPDGAMFWKQTLRCQVLEDEDFTRSE